MRLAIEITTCTASRTGVGYYTEHIVDALLETRRAGDAVVLLSNRPPAPELAARWSPYLRVKGPGVRVLWMQSVVPRLLAEAGADVAIFPNYAVPLASPCPTISVVHDLAILRTPQHFTAQKRLLMRAMLRHAIAAASVIGTVSEASRRDIAALLNVRRERTVLLPAAAHPTCKPASPEVVAEVRARHGLDRPYALTVGTLEPRKNLQTLMRAFDRIDPDVVGCDLVVVGPRGWLDRSLVRELESRAKGRRVRWLGYVTESDLVALYTGAELFLLASTLEGFGLPLLEAMACGTPVIASDVAALREVGGDVPIFVPATDEAAFARAIQNALADKSWMAAAREAGRARAGQFSWTRTAEAIWSRARRVAPERVWPRARRGDAQIERSVPQPGPVDPPPSPFGAREWGLLATVVYADLFDSPLGVDEACTGSLGVVLDEADIRRLAADRRLQRFVTLHPNGYLALAGRENGVDAMPERTAATRQLLDRNRVILRVLARLPFVRSIVISGGVAHKNLGTRPDIDLFVVAARGRAYTAYTMLFLATKLTDNRRLICPNYLVDEDELEIAYHHDLFTAHQIQSSRPYSGTRTYEALCYANEAWVRRFFPGFTPRAAPYDERPSVLQRAVELALMPTAGVVERGLRWAWRAHLRHRAASALHPDVVLGDGILKLHLSDYRPRTLERFAARLAALRVELEGAQPALPYVDPVSP
jgi:glycosyltransferase involved in cell wall biosynthesis